jgi:hypothetical protein
MHELDRVCKDDYNGVDILCFPLAPRSELSIVR